MTDGAKIIPLRRKLKGGKIVLLMPPGYFAITHVDSKGIETELDRAEQYNEAEYVGRRFAAKFGAQYIGAVFG